MVIALAICSGGLMSSRTAWPSGISDAPLAPCRARAAHIVPMSLAAPHSSEAMVKPAIEAIITRLRPKRLASQPDSGVAMAPAMR